MGPSSGPQLLAFADLHLQWGAWRRRRTLYGDSFFAWRQVVDLAVSGARLDGRPVKAVLAAGDLIDTDTPDDFIVRLILDGLARLEAAGVRFLFVRGQHETVRGRRVEHITRVADSLGLDHVPTSFFGLSRWAEDVDLRVVPVALDGAVVTVAGLDYRPPAEFREACRVLPPADVLLTHQVWEEFVPTGEASFAALPHPYRVVVTGDFHSHLDREVRPGVRVLSPGSACLQAVDEDPDKRVFVLHSDLSAESVPLLCRPVGSAVVKTAADVAVVVRTLDEVPAHPGIPAHVRVPVVRCRIPAGAEAGVAAALEAAVGDRAHLFVDVDDPAGPEAAADPAAAGPPAAGVEAVIAELAPSPAVAALCVALWRGADPDGVVAEFAGRVAAEGVPAENPPEGKPC